MVISLKANYILAVLGAVTAHHITNKMKITKLVCVVAVRLQPVLVQIKNRRGIICGPVWF